MARIHVMNCGGLGNRLNNLVNGIFLARALNRSLILTWPLNNACLCPYDKLYETPIEQTGLEGAREPESLDDYNRLVGERAVLYKDAWSDEIGNAGAGDRLRSLDRSGTGAQLLNELRIETEDVFLQHYNVLDCVPTVDLINILYELKPIAELQRSIDRLATTHGIDKETAGVHIRHTDAASANRSLHRKLEKMMRTGSVQRALLCSDSKEVEERYSTKYPDRIVTIRKDSYVEKGDPGGEWRTADRGEGAYNVRRSEASVQEALIDLYLLARTNFVLRSRSTFSKVAHLLSLGESVAAREGRNPLNFLYLYRVRKFV